MGGGSEPYLDMGRLQFVSSACVCVCVCARACVYVCARACACVCFQSKLVNGCLDKILKTIQRMCSLPFKPGFLDIKMMKASTVCFRSQRCQTRIRVMPCIVY